MGVLDYALEINESDIVGYFALDAMSGSFMIDMYGTNEPLNIIC